MLLILNGVCVVYYNINYTMKLCILKNVKAGLSHNYT